MRKKARGSNVNYTHIYTHVKQTKKKEMKKYIYIFKDQDLSFPAISKVAKYQGYTIIKTPTNHKC